MRTPRRMPLILIALCAALLGLLGAPALPVHAATLTVTKSFDSNDGACTVNDCSLREAIIAANASAGFDIIILRGITYTLSLTGANEDSAATGDLDIRTSMEIISSGSAAHTIIQAHTAQGMASDRVLEIHPGATLSLSSATIRHGNVSGNGGAIANHGALTLVDVHVTASNASGGGFGGGIYNDGDLLAIRSTVSGTHASSSGGGIYNDVDATLALTNSTVSGNGSGSNGGGIRLFGTGTLSAVTLVNNVADENNDGNGDGGGISTTGGTLTLRQTIIGNNRTRTDAMASNSDCQGTGAITVTATSLVETNDGCSFPTANVLTGDPNLGALLDNGGQTPTHLPNPGSPVLDAFAFGTCLLIDQRGVARPQEGNGTAPAVCDIGSVERTAALTLTVTQTADGNDGICSADDCSLREAIIAANGSLETDTIILPAGTYTLSLTSNAGIASEDVSASGDLDILHPITLQGAGAAGTIIQAAAQPATATDRVLQLTEGASGTTISGVTIRHGNAQQFGGGVLITLAENVLIQDTVIRDNIALVPASNISTSGGGLYISDAKVRLLRVAILFNRSDFDGGGLYFDDGSTFDNILPTLDITDSTISGNRADRNGGGLHVESTTTLTNVTITNNVADDENNGTGAGGGIDGIATLRNTLIAGNQRRSDGMAVANDCNAFITAQGKNLIRETAGCTISGATAGVLTGLDPLLGPLAANGGPSPTHALLSTSPAIDTGDSAHCTSISDQRGGGFPRTLDGDSDGVNTCDLGAYEAPPGTTPLPTLIQFSAATFSLTEGPATVTITVTRTGPTSQTLTVQYATSDGTATAGQDYTETTGTLTFNFMETSRTFTIPVINDALSEQAETVTISLSNPSGASLGTPSTATLTINDNDGAQSGAFQFSGPLITVAESAGMIMIEVTRTGSFNGFSSVDYTTSDGTAVAGQDYTATSGTLTFNPGQVGETFLLPILEDSTDEPSELFSITLSNVSGAVLGANVLTRVSITDNDEPPPTSLQFSAATASVAESGGSVVLTVTRSGNLDLTTSVQFATANGSAQAGSDYTATSGTLSFNPQDSSETITVPILEDAQAEGAQTFTVTLAAPTNAGLGSPFAITVTITDNDIGGTVTLQGRTSASPGGGSGMDTFGPGFSMATVRLLKGATTTTATVAADGTFSYPNVAPGGYDIEASAPGYLLARKGITVAAGGLTGLDVQLRAGRVTPDVTITITDVTTLIAAFGQSPPNRKDAGGNIVDLNGDGIVNIRDITLTLGNFGRAEPLPWP